MVSLQTVSSVSANLQVDGRLLLDIVTLAVAALSPFVAYVVSRREVTARFRQAEMELEHQYRSEILASKMAFYEKIGRAFQDLVFTVTALNRIEKGQKLSRDQAEEYWAAAKDFHRAIAEGWHVAPGELLDIASKTGISIGRAVHFARRGDLAAVSDELSEGFAPLFDELRKAIRDDIGMTDAVDTSFGSTIARMLSDEPPIPD